MRLIDNLKKSSENRKKTALSEKNSKNKKLKHSLNMEYLLDETELLQRLGYRNFKTILLLSLIKSKLFRNHIPVKLDLEWRNSVMSTVNLTRDPLKKSLKKLQELDLIKEVEKDHFLINPILIYKGSVSKSFIKSVVYYYSQYDINNIECDTWLSDKFQDEFEKDLQYIEAATTAIHSESDELYYELESEFKKH